MPAECRTQVLEDPQRLTCLPASLEERDLREPFGVEIGLRKRWEEKDRKSMKRTEQGGRQWKREEDRRGKEQEERSLRYSNTEWNTLNKFTMAYPLQFKLQPPADSEPSLLPAIFLCDSAKNGRCTINIVMLACLNH